MRGLRRGVPLLAVAGFATITLAFIVRLERTFVPGSEPAAIETPSSDSPTYGGRSYSVGLAQPLRANERVYARSRDERGRDRLLLFKKDQAPSVLLQTEPGQTIRDLKPLGQNNLLVTLSDIRSGHVSALLSCDGGGTWTEIPFTSRGGADKRTSSDVCQSLAPTATETDPRATPQETLAYVAARRGYIVDYFKPDNRPGTVSWFEGNRGFVSLLDDVGIPVRPWDIGRFRTVHVSASVLVGDWCPEPLSFAGGKLQEDPCRLVRFNTDTGEVRPVALDRVEGLQRGLGFTLLWRN
jgi:hypothetical protein